MGHEKSCGAVIYNKFDDGYKILLIQFQYKDNNVWGFPKGHMEENETEMQTAAREIHEEIGLNVKINPDFKTLTHFSLAEGRVLEAVYFAATTSETETKTQPEEVLSCKWCDLLQAKKLLTYECDKRVLEEFGVFLRENSGSSCLL
ncbi:NUDIX hydrolase [Clostridia bacterium]|nr:NUDIX hydrolase [Clostridia bacterium]